jgi:hypothetical protein
MNAEKVYDAAKKASSPDVPEGNVRPGGRRFIICLNRPDCK